MAIIILLLSICFCPAMAVAQISPEPPPLVRFTGSLLPAVEAQPPRLSTLTVTVKGAKWQMQIAKVEKLTGRSSSGTRLLESIFPRQLRFTGPEQLLNILRDPKIEGHLLVIEGRLYVSERMLLLTNVTESSSLKDNPQ